MQRRSIRFRLTLWYTVVLTAALALFGGLIWISLRHRMLDEVDRALDESARRFEAFFKSELAESTPEGALRDELNEFCQGLPFSDSVLFRSASGFTFRYPADAKPLAKNSRSVRREFHANGELFVLEAWSGIADVEHALDLLRLLLWSLSPAVVAIACAGGWWLSGRALKPVQDITEAAHSISVENLSRRLPVPATGDELARLAGVLNGMLDRLEAAMKTLSQFAGDASHELRTPLSVIRTSAELALRRERTPDAYRESLEEVAAEAERMTALIDDLLTLARGGTEASEMPLEPVALRDVIEETCGKMRGLADLRGIRIDAQCDGSVVSGNRPALQRLFLVLIDNAIKYSRPNQEVRVMLRGGEVSVEDSGIGISPADLPHIFQRFYRADRSRSSDGHGLGLALAENIARAHRASIAVESTEGVGSKFRVVFPAVARASDNLQVTRVN